jgi:hypothetical protein
MNNINKDQRYDWEVCSKMINKLQATGCKPQAEIEGEPKQNKPAY